MKNHLYPLLVWQDRIATVIRLVLFLALLTLTTFAQTGNATLSGTVTDQQGAVVAGAQITVVSAATGVRRQATAGDNGLYTLVQLPPVECTLKAERQGFTPTELARVVLETGARRTACSLIHRPS